VDNFKNDIPPKKETLSIPELAALQPELKRCWKTLGLLNLRVQNSIDGNTRLDKRYLKELLAVASSLVEMAEKNHIR